MSTFVLSDWHCGDPRLDILGRPFSNTKQMVEVLIRNHNYLVKKDDTVIVAGDVCYEKAPEFLKYVNEFNGNKILIRGNHDRVFSDDDFLKYFQKIIPEGEGINLTVGDLKCFVTHYPTRGKEDRFNITGHCHHAWKYQLNMFNCGVDVNHFYPVNSDKLPFHFKAICEFYDEDVWCAYKDINKKYLGIRGKKGSYFQK